MFYCIQHTIPRWLLSRRWQCLAGKSPCAKTTGFGSLLCLGQRAVRRFSERRNPVAGRKKRFPNANATGFWESSGFKSGIAAVFPGRLAAPNRTRKLSCGFRWQPYGKLCCFCVAVTPGAKRCPATPRGYSRTEKKPPPKMAEASGKKSVVFARAGSRENGSSAYRLRTVKPKAVPHTPPTICIKLATWSCTKSMP